MDSLFVIQGNEQGQRNVLDEDVVTIGRDPSNNIQLRDVEASRRHAEIRRVDAVRIVVDLNSSNGVFVNGTRVKTKSLENGDQIQIGRTIFLFASRKIDVGEEEPLVDVLEDGERGAESRIVHSLSPDASDGVFDENDEETNASAWLKKARAHLNFMYHATFAASRTLDVERLLDLFLELIFQWAPVDRGCVFLYDADADKLVPKASKTRKKGGRVEISQTILNYAFRNQKGVLTSAADRDKRWDGSASIFQTGVQEAICVPMQGRYGLVGVIYIDVARKLSDVEFERAAAEFALPRLSDGNDAPPPPTPLPVRAKFSPAVKNVVERLAAAFSNADEKKIVDGESNAPTAPIEQTFPDDYSSESSSLSRENLDVPLDKSVLAVGEPIFTDSFLSKPKRRFARNDASDAEPSVDLKSPFPGASRTSERRDRNKTTFPIDSTWTRRSKKLTVDHLKMMVSLGRQAALAIEDTQFYLGMAQAERLAAIGQTVAVLSHHIKNILQGIRGGSYLISAGVNEKDVELISKGWKIVEKNQAKISDLVLDMLTFSKERTPVWSFADFGKVMEDVVELTKGRANDLEVDLIFTPDETTPKFYFDKEQIHRAIVNLIGNALEASRNYDPDAEPPKLPNGEKAPKFQRGRVETTVRYDAEKKCVFVVVDDVGPGISPEMRDVLFRPFSSKNKSGGTGLGLAVTHKIVVEHKGTISVETSPFGGARFVVELPLVFEKKSELDDVPASDEK